MNGRICSSVSFYFLLASIVCWIHKWKEGVVQNPNLVSNTWGKDVIYYLVTKSLMSNKSVELENIDFHCYWTPLRCHSLFKMASRRKWISARLSTRFSKFWTLWKADENMKSNLATTDFGYPPKIWMNRPLEVALTSMRIQLFNWLENWGNNDRMFLSNTST